VEVHDARELDRALASGARLIGLNNRDLRTLEVDVERAGRLRDHVPDDRLVIAESGVREPRTVARWRARGLDGALVGDALVPADADQTRIDAAIAAFDPDAVQLSGNERAGAATGIPRRTWKVLHLPAVEPATLATVADDLVSRARAHLAGGADRILLDTAGGP